MSQVALTLVVLSAVAVLGLAIGRLKVRGVGLGIGGVLFGGLIVGHFAHRNGWHLDHAALHFIKEFGLILFVYTIGIQVGPGFFASLRQNGLRLNAVAVGIVLLGSLITVGLALGFDLPLNVVLGIQSGAVTNTPSLAAAQQILSELGFTGEQVSLLGTGYAMAYPFGILGILLSMWLVRALLRISVEDEARAWDAEQGNGKRGTLQAINVRVDKPDVDGLPFERLESMLGEDVICSRVKSQGRLVVPGPGLRIRSGDYLHLVGSDEIRLKQVAERLGREADESLSTRGTHLRSVRIVVTNERMLGRKLSELDIKNRYDVVISRLNRAGVELVPNRHTVLQFGDILNIVGDAQAVEYVARLMGNARSKLDQVQMMPIFIGIGLGVLLGSIPVQLPHLPAPIKLGLAGGPLIVALLLARVGNIGPLYWFMPPSANLALRDIGIVLFLAVVGINSGAGFLNTLTEGDGLKWMGYGVLITLLPLFIMGMLARLWLKMNYLSLCGVLAGSMTDPPALAFANALRPDCGASALAYATVYPLVMCLRILSPQLIAVLLWAVWHA
ncbi:putative transporter [Hahella sp. SMD15-11]|uniref:Transporter n=1 Tax=Thermohahella caldifontis TaxID=3142973 RepID=A0AB39URT1_9GAMM